MSSIPSLSSLASSEIARRIVDGRYKNTPFLLAPPMSNMVFEKIDLLALAEKPENYEEIEKKLKLTKIHLHNFRVNENIVDMMCKQDHLETLSFGDIIDFSVKYRDYRKKFKIGKFLRESINEKTRVKLRHLKILHEWEWEDLWMIEASKHFPHLESLIVKTPVDRRVQQLNFAMLTHYLRSLKHLDISCSEIQDLPGIEALVHLETLKMVYGRVNNEEDIKKLCELKNLKVLTVSHYRDYLFFRHLGECLEELDSPLPSLSFLDCACTDLTSTDFRKIYSNLPRLEMISLIGDENIIDFSSVPKTLKVLNCATLTSTLASLKFVMSSPRQTFGNLDEILKILESIEEKFDNFNSLEFEVQVELIDVVCDSLEELVRDDIGDYYENLEAGSLALNRLCNDSIIPNLPPSTIRHILHVYWKRYSSDRELLQRPFRCQANFWDLFGRSNFISLLRDNEWIFEAGMCLFRSDNLRHQVFYTLKKVGTYGQYLYMILHMMDKCESDPDLLVELKSCVRTPGFLMTLIQEARENAKEELRVKSMKMMRKIAIILRDTEEMDLFCTVEIVLALRHFILHQPSPMQLSAYIGVTIFSIIQKTGKIPRSMVKSFQDLVGLKEFSPETIEAIKSSREEMDIFLYF